MIEKGDESLLSQTNILLVEDNLINGKLVTKLLELSGFNVEWARNGFQAIERIEKSPHFYNMVFMDVQMPEMDGIEATKRIRKMGFDIPIVAMTAHALSKDRTICLEAGMNDFITKPLNREELVEMVKMWGSPRKKGDSH